MDAKKWVLTGAMLLLLVVVGSAAGAPDPLAADPAPPIRLQAGTFVPSQMETLNAPDALIVDEPPAGVGAYYIVQFAGPVQEAWKNGVRKAGGEILEYLPDYAFKVFMTPEQAQVVSRERNVIWTGLFQPAFKLDPQLSLDAPGLVRVSAEANASSDQVAAQISAAGVRIVRQEGGSFVVLASSSQVDDMAAVGGVAWIEPFLMYETHNEYGAGVILGANTAAAGGYDGSTQIAAIADTGLGGGTKATAHADIPGSRITAIQNFTASSSSGCYQVLADGAKDVDSGHGTHTSLSMVGDGGSGGIGRGSAPAAKLVFQAVEEYVDFIGYPCASLYADGYYLLGLPTNLGDLYQPAYNAGARVHSNSWGSSAAGAYTTDSAETDDFMWNNPDLLVTFSAGNAGEDANANGVIDDDSIGSPATAKNVLTVGASENDRGGSYPCDSSLTYAGCSGQNSIGTYYQSWPSDFPANPIKDDPVAGNAEQMAGFSSRGPTDDGRIKPDVVAPGTWVLSGYSDLYQQGYDAGANPQNGAYQYDGWGYPLNSAYKYMGGTSMSNPLAAGAAVVVRDYYQKAHSHAASAALVKATLINSAVDMLDENNDGANDNDFPIPNNHEGWGRVNLAAAVDGSQSYIDNPSGLSTGGAVSYQYEVAAGQPLKITLVWTDHASTAAAAANLVNDLNLKVTAPGGAVYRGNNFSGGWSQTGGSADSVNNVENVYIASPAAGAWQVEVSGANIPNGPQPFALVVDYAQNSGSSTGPVIYVSSTTGGKAGGVSFADEDIMAFDTDSGTWSLYMDGSDIGLGGAGARDVDAFYIMDDGSILLSIFGPSTLPDVGSVDDSDIVRFVPTSLGSSTSGTFEWYFDGSDVGLTKNGEDIDAIHIISGSSLVISTAGGVNANGASGKDEDLLLFSPVQLGATTSGTFSLLFDGSDVGLNTNGYEDVWGSSMSDDGRIFLTTKGSFSVSGVSGDSADILSCTPSSLGANTACTFELYWDGSANGYAGEAMDGLMVVP